MIVESAQFHRMRGHVAQGVKVIFPDGVEWRIATEMAGFVLLDEAGKRLSPPGAGGASIDALINERHSDLEAL